MPFQRSSPKIMHRARQFRKELTSAEGLLWTALRHHQLDGVGFRRSHAIGRYIADFCAPSLKLIVELDGEPHRAQPEADAQRTQDLAERGYRVMRFWNWQVMDDLDRVLKEIRAAMANTE